MHSTVIGRWKREALASMEAGFSGKLDVQQNNHAVEVKELHAKIGAWLAHYNHTRPHSTFNGQTPGEVYNQKIENQGHAPDVRKRAA